MHDCRNGHVCARLEAGAPRVCAELCDPFRVVAPPCGGGGRLCVTEVYGEGANLGICLPVLPPPPARTPPRITGFRPPSPHVAPVNRDFGLEVLFTEADGDEVTIQWFDATCPRCAAFANTARVVIDPSDFVEPRCGRQEALIRVRVSDTEGAVTQDFALTLDGGPC